MKGIDRKGGSVMKLSRRSFLAQSAAGIATGLGVPTFAANAVPEIFRDSVRQATDAGTPQTCGINVFVLGLP